MRRSCMQKRKGKGEPRIWHKANTYGMRRQSLNGPFNQIPEQLVYDPPPQLCGRYSTLKI